MLALIQQASRSRLRFLQPPSALLVIQLPIPRSIEQPRVAPTPRIRRPSKPEAKNSTEPVEPIAPPESSNAPLSLPAVDWLLEAERAAQRAAEQAPPSALSKGKPRKRDFGWSKHRIKRIEQVEGATILRLSERCVLVNFLLPFCKYGKIEARGDLFEGMNDPPEEIE